MPSGALSRYTKYSFDALGRQVVETYKAALKDAVLEETNVMNREMNKAVRNVTMRNVYSYEPAPWAKHKRRYFHNGGIGDPDNYAVRTYEDANGDMQIVFYQEKTILPQGNTSGEGAFDVSGDEGSGRGTKLDLRYVVENAPSRWKQPYKRPYFEDIAIRLSEDLPGNIQRRVAQSMRMRGF